MSKTRGRGTRSEPRCYSRVDDEVSLSTGSLGEALKQYLANLREAGVPIRELGSAVKTAVDSQIPVSKAFAAAILVTMHFNERCLANDCEQGRRLWTELHRDMQRGELDLSDRHAQLAEHLSRCDHEVGRMPRSEDELFTSPAFVRRIVALCESYEQEGEGV